MQETPIGIHFRLFTSKSMVEWDSLCGIESFKTELFILVYTLTVSPFADPCGKEIYVQLKAFTAFGTSSSTSANSMPIGNPMPTANE